MHGFVHGFLALILCLGALGAGCARRESPVERGNRDQTLHLGNGSEPKDLDPHVVTGVTEHNIISALIEGLVSEDPQSPAPAPGVASHWDIGNDGKTYTFHLRPEAVWSNGDPVTAHDFVFAFQRILTPELGAPYAYMLYGLTGAEAFHRGATTSFADVGAQAVDPHTLELRLAAPIPYFLALLNHYSWYPVHPPTIRRFGNAAAGGSTWTRPEHFVGNGAFVLASWQPNKTIVVRKSPTYWNRERVALNAIHFHAIGDHQVEERSFRAGQLHVTSTIPMDRIAYYREKHPERIRIAPYLGCYYYLFNVTRPPLDDPRVRLALCLAIDREQLVTHVTKGGEQPAYHFTPPNTAGYTSEARLTGGIDTARRLLAEAGYPNGAGLRPLQILYNTSDAHGRIAQVIQQMWKQNLGLNVGLLNMEWKVYLDQTQRGDFDIARAGWIGDYVDPNSFLDLWVTDGGNNRARWSNRDYDAAIHAAANTTDSTARLRHFQRAEAVLLREAPILPLYFYVSKSLIQPSVRGWHDHVLDHHPYTHIHLEKR
jgi:oligopeptide transport system substrate-binding protein